MTIAYEVSATMAIIDRASPALERILVLSRQVAANFEVIKGASRGLFSSAGINRFAASLGRIDPALAKIVGEMEKVRSATTAGLGEMDRSLALTTDAVRALKAELAGAATAAKSIGRASLPGLPAAGGGRSGRGGGGGGIHASGSAAVPFVPGTHLSTRMGIGLMAGGAAAYGAYEEGELRDATARMLFLAGQPLADMPHQTIFKDLRKRLLDVYTLTGASLEDIEEAGTSVVKLMAGFPMEQRMSVLQTALTFGAQEHRLNPQVSVTQGADALVGLLHQTGIYDPEKIKEFTPKIAALSTITNMPLSRVMTAAGYSMPIASANLGVDSDTILLLMTAMQRAGVTNTKSGTWLREAITKTITGTFTSTSHGSEAQKAGLRALGLLDKDGKSTVIDAQGHLDLFREMEIINEARSRLAGPDFLRAERQAFGVQGSQGISVLTEPQIIQQLPQLREWMMSMPGGEEFFKDMFDASPAQAAKSTLAEFNRSLMDVGSTALPAVTDALKGFDAVLKGLNNTLESAGVPNANGVASWGLVGMGALALRPTRSMLRRAWRYGRGLLGGGAEATASEAALSGAGEAAAAGAGAGLLPRLGGAALGSLPAAGIALEVLAPFAAIGARLYYDKQHLNDPPEEQMARMLEQTGFIGPGSIEHAPITAQNVPPAFRPSVETVAGQSTFLGRVEALFGSLAKLTGLGEKPLVVQLVLDGKIITEAVVNRIAKEANRPSSSTSDFDSRRDYTPAYYGGP